MLCCSHIELEIHNNGDMMTWIKQDKFDMIADRQEGQ
jgi:hypothetical protein